MGKGYTDVLDYIDNEYEFDAYESYDDFIDDVRSNFSNDNLIDSIQEELEMMYTNYIEQ